MLLWTWNRQEVCWQAQPLLTGEEIALLDEAHLWVPQGDLALLFARPCVAINGNAALPVQVLNDRDEIQIGTWFYCFSLDSSAEREQFQATIRQTYCARCQTPFIDGDLTQRCSQCGARYHDTPELGCWTYGPACTCCHRPTIQQAWQPAPLGRHRTRGHRHGSSTPR